MKRAMGAVLVLVFMIVLVACVSKASTWQEQYDLGVRYLSDGEYKEAIIAFNAAIKIEPGNAETYLKAAEAYAALGDDEGLIDLLARGYAATGDDRMLVELGMSLSNPFSELLPTVELQNIRATLRETYSDIGDYVVNTYGADNFGGIGWICNGCTLYFEEPIAVTLGSTEILVDRAVMGYPDDVEVISSYQAFDDMYLEKKIIISGKLGIDLCFAEDTVSSVMLLDHFNGDPILLLEYENGEREYWCENGGFWYFAIDDISIEE